MPLNLRNRLARRVVDSKGNDLAKVVGLIQSYRLTTSQKCAREIMGKNFFGIEEAIKHFGVNPTSASNLPLFQKFRSPRQCSNNRRILIFS